MPIDRRLRRSASALDRGVEILTWLHEPAQRAALIKAAEAGMPSVAGISAAFFAKFGEATSMVIVRQFVGRAVKHIMSDAGYDAVDSGVKLINDPVFVTGTRYRNRKDWTPGEKDKPLLERIVESLSLNELRHLQKLVTYALNGK